VPAALIDRGGFAFASAIDVGADSAEAANAWQLLERDLGNDSAGRPIVPTILDASTAIYSLKLKGVGSRLEIRDSADHGVTLEVVGLLSQSVLQGNLLVSEANFLQMFPDTGGFRFFLIERGPDVDATQNPVNPRPTAGDAAMAGGSRHALGTLDASRIGQLLESTLAADGFDVRDANEELAGFLAVQNTYISTFQSLGALGLVLGTLGLAVVQLRSVVERRGELALMRATGFPPGRLLRMVLWENALLLVGGLAVGLAAALVALLPQWIPRQASVPWATLTILLLTIVVIGLAAGWLVTRSVLRAPIVPALRGE
jgi:ABC-type antimicrobial peptide transport system permease subunit